MKRQSIGDGRWFDREKALCLEESTYFDGNNHVSKATNSQWEHEQLFRTKSGFWILHHWSQYQGVKPTWEEIDNKQAAEWLVKNDRDPMEACAEEYASLEL
jgi:hypothetical protein